MICPNFGKKISQEVIKCTNCGFNLNNALDEFYKREKRIHNNISQIRIKSDIKIHEERIKLTDFLFKITSKNSFKDKLIEYNISDEVWNCLQFCLISKIYLGEITGKSQIKNNLVKLLKDYDGEYDYNVNILSKNLSNLINLAGINPFSKYYLNQLNFFKLSIVEGLEVLGRIIDDLLYNEIKLVDLDLKIKNFMKETVNDSERINYENNLNNAINEYFVLTGRDYFSVYFENQLLKYEFTIDDAYNIKELFLKKIFIKGVRKNLKDILNNIILSYFSSSGSIVDSNEDRLYLIENSYIYYDSIPIEKGLKKKKDDKKSRDNRDDFIKIESEELGSDDYSYEDQLDFEREILGDF